MLKVERSIPMAATQQIYSGNRSTDSQGLAYYNTGPSTSSTQASRTSNPYPSRFTHTSTYSTQSYRGNASEQSTSSNYHSLDSDLKPYSHVPSRKAPQGCSVSTVENVRYSLEHDSMPDHHNEDRYFAIDGGNYIALGVFDGHDGDRAANMASRYIENLLDTTSWKSVISQGREVIPQALEEFFKATDKEFFNSLRPLITERNKLKQKIPQHLKSYEAYQRYPVEVSRLQEIEPAIAGGCTAAMVILANHMVYAANVGDSRVLLIKQKPDGTLVAEQLTEDDTIENEFELRRLERLGLKREDLIRAGRLGTQDNTRSIGDYNIKEGFRDVDSLSSATAPPGTAVPHIVGRALEPTFKYMVIMSDGVYKSIESTFANPSSIDPNKVLVNMILKESTNLIRDGEDMSRLAGNILRRLEASHFNVYFENAVRDPRSPLATACRKRDDMTLIIHTFPTRRRSLSIPSTEDILSP